MTKPKSYFSNDASAAPLAVFRIIFGLMMLASIIRFWALGWIDKLYIQPKFFFSYYGFEWVKPFGEYTYYLFFLCGLSALFVALGIKYRLSIITFFLSFTYIELMDKTTYLNHYYFISLVSFLLIFLPAGGYLSWDSIKGTQKPRSIVFQWQVDSIRLLLAIVYFYAGLAKLNSDWLIDAMPLKIWLPTSNDIPVIGSLFSNEWVIYGFTWMGAMYDLSIPFLLYFRKTRLPGFVGVVIFHGLTTIMFPIGMFPYIMILSTLIFFGDGFHMKIVDYVRALFHIRDEEPDSNDTQESAVSNWTRLKVKIIALFFLFQLIFPFRHLLYPNELFWTEEGYRFSWRVMLMEKAGHAQFKIVDTETGKWFIVQNSDFLTPFQEKQMATQPDFILEYAHFLKDHFYAQGHRNISVFVDSFVALNGRRSTRYIDPEVDLTQYQESFKHKPWVLPFNDEISGL